MALTDSLVSYYSLEANGNDSLGTNNMTEANITYVTGKIANAASFNWSTSTMRNSTIALASWSTPYSINFWVKLKAEIASWVWALSFLWADATSQDTVYYIEYQYNAWTRRLNYQHYYNWPETYYTLPYTVTLWTSNWNMVTVTYSGSWMILYFNWTSVATWWWSGTFWSSLGADYQKWLTIWSQYVSSTYGNRSNAIIDEFWYWSRAITAGEITQLYNGWNWLAYPLATGNSNFFMFF